MALNEQGITNQGTQEQAGLPPVGGGTTQNGQPAPGSGQPQQPNSTQQTDASTQDAPVNLQVYPEYRKQKGDWDRREAQLTSQLDQNQRMIDQLNQQVYQLQQQSAEQEQAMVNLLPDEQRGQYQAQRTQSENEQLRSKVAYFEHLHRVQPLREQVMYQYGPEVANRINWGDPVQMGMQVMQLQASDPQYQQQPQQMTDAYALPFTQDQNGTYTYDQPGYQPNGQAYAPQQQMLPTQGTHQNQQHQQLQQMVLAMVRDSLGQLTANQVDMGGNNTVYTDMAAWDQENQRLRETGDMAGFLSHQGRRPR